MQTAFENGTLTLFLTEHVDSTNAPEPKEKIRENLGKKPGGSKKHGGKAVRH